MSLKSEINTLPLIETALNENKKLFLPRVEKDKTKQSDKITFYRINANDLHRLDSWSRSSFGIREPFPTEPLRPDDFPALIFTPGLAFDREGNRLGHGRAYYDRFFGEIKDLVFTAAGLCMEPQLVPSVPVDEWDQKIDSLFAEPEFETYNRVV